MTLSETAGRLVRNTKAYRQSVPIKTMMTPRECPQRERGLGGQNDEESGSHTRCWPQTHKHKQGVLGLRVSTDYMFGPHTLTQAKVDSTRTIIEKLLPTQNQYCLDAHNLVIQPASYIWSVQFYNQIIRF